MKNRRRLGLWATTLAVAFAASAVNIGSAAASAPPTTTPSPPSASPTNDQSPPEAVESWALAPASAATGGQGGDRPELSYQSAAGTTIQDAVTLYNYGNVQLTFRVYATDAFNNADGQFDLLPGAQKPVDAGSWVTVSQEIITLPPGKQVTIPVTIKIPADAAPGDHAGAIVASNAATGSNDSGQVVQLDRRTGTRMYVRVAGPVSAELAVSQVKTTYHQSANPLDGSAHVTFVVSNSGNVRLGGVATVSIAGPFGIGETKVALPALTELLPGQHVNVVANLKGVPALVIDTTHVSVVPSGAADLGTLKVVAVTNRTFAPPITALIILCIVLFAVLAWRAYRRHRRAGLGAAAVERSADEREYQPT